MALLAVGYLIVIPSWAVLPLLTMLARAYLSVPREGLDLSRVVFEFKTGGSLEHGRRACFPEPKCLPQRNETGLRRAVG
jgi:hypothetical protein